MRAHFVEVPPPLFDDHLRLGARAKPFEAQTLVAELAVEALRNAILPTLAGPNAVPMPCAMTHDSSALDTNSGPLSLRKNIGAPRSLTRRDSTSMTPAERIRPATSIASPSLVNSSVTVRHLSCWPLAQWSNTKS